MRLMVTGEHTLDMVLRTLNCLLIHGCTPHYIQITSIPEGYAIVIDDDALDAERNSAILEKLRSLVSIEVAEIIPKHSSCRA